MFGTFWPVLKRLGVVITKVLASVWLLKHFNSKFWTLGYCWGPLNVESINCLNYETDVDLTYLLLHLMGRRMRYWKETQNGGKKINEKKKKKKASMDQTNINLRENLTKRAWISNKS